MPHAVQPLDQVSRFGLCTWVGLVGGGGTTAPQTQHVSSRLFLAVMQPAWQKQSTLTELRWASKIHGNPATMLRLRVALSPHSRLTQHTPGLREQVTRPFIDTAYTDGEAVRLRRTRDVPASLRPGPVLCHTRSRKLRSWSTASLPGIRLPLIRIMKLDTAARC